MKATKGPRLRYCIWRRERLRSRTSAIDLRVFGSGDFPASYECDSRLFDGNKSATGGNAQITGYLSGI